MVYLKDVLAKAITEREAFVYLFKTNGKMTYREIGDIIGLSYTQVGEIYNSAKKKIEG